MATVTKTAIPNGVATVDQIFTTLEQRFAPVPYELPDYPGTVVEIQMLNSGEEEHCEAFARRPDGSRNSDAYVRIYAAYGLAMPKFHTDRNRRIEAERIATIFEGFPTDWILPVFRKALELTTEYQQRRIKREEEQGDNVLPFSPNTVSAPASSPTDSGSSPAKSSS